MYIPGWLIWAQLRRAQGAPQGPGPQWCRGAHKGLTYKSPGGPTRGLAPKSPEGLQGRLGTRESPAHKGLGRLTRAGGAKGHGPQGPMGGTRAHKGPGLLRPLQIVPGSLCKCIMWVLPSRHSRAEAFLASLGIECFVRYGLNGLLGLREAFFRAVLKRRGVAALRAPLKSLLEREER